jgi:hypothetical protein
LRVDHLVDTDEVRADDVPVHVLERQMQIVVGAELLLQQLRDFARVLVRHSGNGESGHVIASFGFVMYRLPAAGVP